eukprot:1156184-Pelagomonas_calceolata.AAC.5
MTPAFLTAENRPGKDRFKLVRRCQRSVPFLRGNIIGALNPCALVVNDHASVCLPCKSLSLNAGSVHPWNCDGTKLLARPLIKAENSTGCIPCQEVTWCFSPRCPLYLN